MNLIGGGMIGNSNCIVTNLNGLILNQPPTELNPFQFLNFFLYINKNDRAAHFVGHSKLKELDIDDFYKRKNMNEEMEAELTEMDSIPDHLEESEDEGVVITVCFNIKRRAMSTVFENKGKLYT